MGMIPIIPEKPKMAQNGLLIILVIFFNTFADYWLVAG
jgi:hypothetical protein